MITDADLYRQLPHVLTRTNLNFLGERYEGKVRDNYSQSDVRILITSDRLSCFDVVVTTIPFKGQVLTELAAHWFALTKHIIPNHLIDLPDPNVMVARNCTVFPVEIVVRAYLTGSAWRDYEAGRAVSGVKLPPGLRASEKLPEVIITPSTKAAKGEHDMPISEEEILSSGLVDKKQWAQAREAALALFALGQREAEKSGLLLVDTKYELGFYKDRLMLVDEVHTLDSSRYWVRESYERRFLSGEPPEMLDKEPTRQWLLSKGFMGNGPVPEFTDTHRVQIAHHYIDSYQRIARKEFEGEVGPAAQRIEARMKGYRLPL
jgi:phosphoribosylaminoimidazole-succinocarboxamide synthase